MKLLTWSRDVLAFRPTTSRNTATVRRHLRIYRAELGIGDRCDNESCVFHSSPLVWNGQVFLPIMDHLSGNRFDNRPHNLRFLCPNCDSQLGTRGGGNRGRVSDVDVGKFTLTDRETGRLDLNILPAAAALAIVGHAPTVTVTNVTKDPTSTP